MIVGLIVSGVVGGQALIESARTNETTQQFAKYRSAFLMFQEQYNAEPGDMANAHDYWDDGTDDVCGTDTVDHRGCNGNGNHRIGEEATADVSAFSETLRFWMHLQLAKLIPPTIVGYSFANNSSARYTILVTVEGMSGFGGAPGPVVPISSIKEGVGFIMVNPVQDSGRWDPPTFYGKSGAWLMLSLPSNSSGQVGKAGSMGERFGRVGQAALTPSQAAAIDKKMDDGFPTTGKVIATEYWEADGTSTGDCATTPLPPRDMDIIAPSTSITYNVANTNSVCNILFHIGGR